MGPVLLMMLAADPFAALRELPKQLPLDASVVKVSPVPADSPDGTDRLELLAGATKLVMYVARSTEPALSCPVRAGQRVRVISADMPMATRVEFRVVESGRICKGRMMLTLTVMGANPSERLRAGVTPELNAPAKEQDIDSQRISVSVGSDERPLTVTPYRFDTSNKFYVAPSFASCVFKMGDALDVPPVQWSVCSGLTRCFATDAKTGTPCTLWFDAVQVLDTLPDGEKPLPSTSR